MWLDGKFERYLKPSNHDTVAWNLGKLIFQKMARICKTKIGKIEKIEIKVYKVENIQININKVENIQIKINKNENIEVKKGKNKKYSNKN